MIVAHLSDLHLGYRAYFGRKVGANVREEDVARVFLAAVDDITGIGPSLILVSGDVFHVPDPPSTALVTFSRGIARLRETLPEAPILIVAGAHDLPWGRHAPGAIAAFDGLPGVHVAWQRPRWAHLPLLDARVALIPHRWATWGSGGEGPVSEGEAALSGWNRPGFAHSHAGVTAEPHGIDGLGHPPPARWTLLLSRVSPGAWRLHANGVEEPGRTGVSTVEPVGDGSEPIGPEAGAAFSWDYAALGGSHAHRKVGQRAYVAGSLERIGPEPWTEAAQERGFITFDLASARARFHPVADRPVVEMAPITAARSDPATVSRRIREAAEAVPGGVDGRIVRLPVVGFPPEKWNLVDAELLAGLSNRASHFQLEPVWRPGARAPADELSPGGPPSLVQRLESRLGGAEREGSGDDSLRNAVEGRLKQSVVQGGGAPWPPAPWGLRGLVLLASEDAGARERHAATSLSVPAEREDARPARPAEVVEAETEPARTPPDAVVRRFVADLSVRPDGARLDACAELLTRFAGADVLDELLTELGHSVPPATRSSAPPPQDLTRLEQRLQDLRADAVEAEGDLEVRTMEWLRERQDAETHLQAYRDRARELRARLGQLEGAGSSAHCPICRRVLDDAYDMVLAELRDEWDAVVQDGRWWKRRREQLELKPAPLQELENRVVRLHAATERYSGRLERARVRHDSESTTKVDAVPDAAFEPDDVDDTGRPFALDTAERPPTSAPAAIVPTDQPSELAPRSSRDERGRMAETLTEIRSCLFRETRQEIRSAAGEMLARMTAGAQADVDVAAREASAELRTGADARVEARLRSLATNVAVARVAGAMEMPVGWILLPEALEGLSAYVREQVVAALRAILPEVPTIVITGGPRTVEGCPEAWDHVRGVG